MYLLRVQESGNGLSTGMFEIGKMNTLPVVRVEERGLYLEAGNDGTILLPVREAPEGARVGEELEVFVYRDSEDRLIATTLQPKAMVGEFAALMVKEVSTVGAFLEWGLMKDLMLPFGQQKRRVREGEKVVVRVYEDEETRRIVATTRLGRYLDKDDREFSENEAVQLMVVDRTDLGWRCLVDGIRWGLLYHDQIFQNLKPGLVLTGYVQATRSDGKLDVALQPSGVAKVLTLAERILADLAAAGGQLPISDKMSAEEIQRRYQVSKKTFKKALGQLYRERKVRLEGDAVILL